MLLLLSKTILLMSVKWSELFAGDILAKTILLMSTKWLKSCGMEEKNCSNNIIVQNP
jgi:hypothetical protein